MARILCIVISGGALFFYFWFKKNNSLLSLWACLAFLNNKQ